MRRAYRGGLIGPHRSMTCPVSPTTGRLPPSPMISDVGRDRQFARAPFTTSGWRYRVVLAVASVPDRHFGDCGLLMRARLWLPWRVPPIAARRRSGVVPMSQDESRSLPRVVDRSTFHEQATAGTARRSSSDGCPRPPELGPQLARGLVLPDRFYSQRVASQKTRHSLHSRGAEKTCQSSLRLLTWR